MKPGLIIFDCDGVLLDSQAVINTLEWDYLLHHGMQMTLEEFTRRFCGVKASTIIETLRKENNIRLLKNAQDIIKEIDNLILTKLSSEKIPPIKGVKDALQIIPFKKCVASNASLRVLRPLLLASGLVAYFDNNIFSADIVERPKPYPDLFLCAARSMKVEPKQCLVIEDSEAGVKAAVAAGMKAWGFLGGSHVNPETAGKLLGSGAERVFQTMDELPKLLKIYQERRIA